jgi:type I restriction enzyme S subunit
MTGKQLKNSILQWAIQGKLVPQDPNDEPASVLLEKIRAEKARLIQEGKIKKDKKESIIYRGEDNSYYEKFTATGEVKCIDEEIPFEIPRSWEWCRICHLFVTSSGSTPQSKNPLYYSKGTINWVRTTDLNNGILDSCEIQITPKAVLDYNLSIIPQESICIAMYGGSGTIGKHSIIRFDTTINQSVCAIHPNSMCNMEYVHIFMQYQRPYWMDFAAGSRKDPNINQIIIKNCLIPIPPKKEQDKIVSKYNVLFPLIDNYSEANEQRKRLNEDIVCTLKKSILQEAIQGKLAPQDPADESAFALLERIREEKLRLVKEGKLKKKDAVDSVIYKGDDNKYYEQVGNHCIDITDDIPFDIPSNWVWTRIGYLFAHNNGKQLNKGNSAGILMEYITTSNLYWDGFRLENLKRMPFEENEIERCQAIKGDLLVCEGGDVGRSCIWPYDNPIMLQNHIHKLRAYLPLCTKYFFYIFNLYNLTGLIGGKGIGIQGFSAKALHNTIIPLPPLKEQERIVKKIKTVFDKIKG